MNLKLSMASALAGITMVATPLASASADSTRGSSANGTSTNVERGSSAGQAVMKPSVIATSPWARPTFGMQTVGVVYMALSNTSGKAVELASVTSPVAGRVEVHTHTMSNGVMKMRKLEGQLKIQPGQTVLLKPSGLHLMLIDVKSKIKVGQKVPLMLNFADGSSLAVEAAVMKKAPAMGRGSMSGEGTKTRGSSAGSAPTN